MLNSHSRVFWLAAFDERLQRLLDSDRVFTLPPEGLSEELEELQGLIGRVTLSPIDYVERIKLFKTEIEQHVDRPFVKMSIFDETLVKFNDELKADTAFTLENFETDLLRSLIIQEDKSLQVGIVEVLDFYRNVIPQEHFKAILKLLETCFNAYLPFLIKTDEQSKKKVETKYYKLLTELKDYFETAKKAYLSAEDEGEEEVKGDLIAGRSTQAAPSSNKSSLYRFIESGLQLGAQAMSYMVKNPLISISYLLATEVAITAVAAEPLKAMTKTTFKTGTNSLDIHHPEDILKQASSAAVAQNSPIPTEIPSAIKYTSYEQVSNVLRSIQKRTVPNNEVLISTNTTGSSLSHSFCVTLDDGTIAMAWSDIGSLDPSAEGVYMQRLDANLNKISSEILVNTYTTSSQIYPVITKLTNGSLVVAWQSLGQDGSDYGVYSQMFDASLNKIYGEVRLNTYTTNAQNYPTVAPMDNGGYVAVWQSYGQDGSDFGIYGQQMFANNTKNGVEFRVNSYTANYQSFGQIKRLTNGNLLAAWVSNGQDGSVDGIYAQLYNASMSVLVPEFRANTYTPNYQNGVTSAVLTKGNFFIGWHDNVRDGSGYGVYGQVFNSTSAMIGNDIQFNTYTAGDQLSLNVVGLDDNGFIGVWQSSGQDGSSGGIYAQQFNELRQKVGAEFRINTVTLNNQDSSRIIQIDDGHCLITWRGQNAAATAYNAYGRIINTRILATGLNQTQPYTEDTPQPFQPFEITMPLYAPNVTATLTLNPSTAGSLSVNTSNNVTATYNPLTGVWRASGPLADVNNVLNLMTFNPTLNYNQDVTIQSSYSNGINPDVTGLIQMPGTPVNDSPVLNITNTPVNFVEDDTVGVLINQNITIIDIDNTNLASATIAITQNFNAAEDRLVFNDNSGSIASSYNATTGVLRLTGSANITEYTTALESARYLNTNIYNPSSLPRTITFSVNDGLASSNTVSQVITITLVNDAPVLTATPGGVVYTMDNSILGVYIDSGISLTDLDSNTMVNATVAFADGWISSQDVLQFYNQNGIIGSYDANNGVLVMSGQASNNFYQAALRTIVYRNGSSNPVLGIRNVTISINDGLAESNLVLRFVNVTTPISASSTTMQSSASATATTGSVTTGGSAVSSTTANTQTTTSDLSATTGNVPSTTGNTPSTTSSASSTTSNSLSTTGELITEQSPATSSSKSNNNITIGAAVGGGVGLTLLAGAAAIYIKHARNKRKQFPSDIEMQQRNSFNFSRSDSANSILVVGSTSSIPQESPNSMRISSSNSMSNSANSLRDSASPDQYRSSVRINKNRTVIGNKYELVNKITDKEAEALFTQTGITVEFGNNKKKAKFTLGQGQFGKLRLARNRDTGEFVGVKKIKNTRPGVDAIVASKNEAEIQKKLSRKLNIMPLLDSFETEGSDDQPVLYQFMPLAGFGNGDVLKETLVKLTPDQKILKEHILVHVARSLLNGALHMEQEHIYHGDIKPSNFVIDRDGNVKIIDFGCAEEFPDNIVSGCPNGDSRYYSPERLAKIRSKDPSYQNKSNYEVCESFEASKDTAWAIGVSLFEIMFNRPPFGRAGLSTKLREHNSKFYAEALASIRELQNPAPGSIFELIKGLLESNPEKRLNIQQAMGMEIFTSLSSKLTPVYIRHIFSQLKLDGALAISEQQNEIAKEEDENYVRSYFKNQYVNGKKDGSQPVNFIYNNGSEEKQFYSGKSNSVTHFRNNNSSNTPPSPASDGARVDTTIAVYNSNEIYKSNQCKI